MKTNEVCKEEIQYIREVIIDAVSDASRLRGICETEEEFNKAIMPMVQEALKEGYELAEPELEAEKWAVDNEITVVSHEGGEDFETVKFVEEDDGTHSLLISCDGRGHLFERLDEEQIEMFQDALEEIEVEMVSEILKEEKAGK